MFLSYFCRGVGGIVPFSYFHRKHHTDKNTYLFTGHILYNVDIKELMAEPYKDLCWYEVSQFYQRTYLSYGLYVVRWVQLNRLITDRAGYTDTHAWKK
jgi:hypothetical protein